MASPCCSLGEMPDREEWAGGGRPGGRTGPSVVKAEIRVRRGQEFILTGRNFGYNVAGKGPAVTKTCIGHVGDDDDDDDAFNRDGRARFDQVLWPDENLVKAVYDEICRRRGGITSREPADLLKQTTSILHDVMIALAAAGWKWSSEGHYMAVAALAMQRYVIDRARERQARSRRGWKKADVDLEALASDAPGSDARDQDLIDLNVALERLLTRDKRMAAVVRLKFFGDLTDAQVGVALDVSEKTVERDWRSARVWLKNEIRRIRESRGEHDAA